MGTLRQKGYSPRAGRAPGDQLMLPDPGASMTGRLELWSLGSSYLLPRSQGSFWHLCLHEWCPLELSSAPALVAAHSCSVDPPQGQVGPRQLWQEGASRKIAHFEKQLPVTKLVYLNTKTVSYTSWTEYVYYYYTVLKLSDWGQNHLSPYTRPEPGTLYVCRKWWWGAQSKWLVENNSSLCTVSHLMNGPGFCHGCDRIRHHCY